MMMPMRYDRGCAASILWLLFAATGCQRSTPQPPAESSTGAVAVDGGTSAEPDVKAVAPTQKRRFQPVQLGGTVGATSNSAATEQQAESVLSAMQPLQILLGKWNGTSRKAQLDAPEWVWDFRSNRSQPALKFQSEKNVYIRSGELTYLPDERKYQFSWSTPDGEQRVLKGDFTKAVQDVAGDGNNKQLQRTYKLTLTEPPSPSSEQWQLAIEQFDNDRYVVEIERRRGAGAFQRLDTINTLREGTSFALSDSDYGDRTCIISQGLGTMTVSYKGQSFYVCCTGCKAAFEEDPPRWIAKWEARQKAKMATP